MTKTKSKNIIVNCHRIQTQNQRKKSYQIQATQTLKPLPRTCSLESSNTKTQHHSKQNINDNSQKAEDVRQSRTQVGFI